jgi:hypothetical protein
MPASRKTDASHEILVGLLSILAPSRNDLVAFYQTFLDESDSHDGADAICVAAYLFEKEACAKLDLEWHSALSEFGLPYFHMVDCVHLVEPFDKLTREQSIEAEKRMIALIRDHMLFGAAMTVNEKDYNTWAARKELGTAYTYCCWQTITMVNTWMDDQGLDGQLGYFFEAGHTSAGETNSIMGTIAMDPEMKAEYRYASHTFVDKEKVRPIQTADIFAWLHANHFKRIRRGEKRPRKDYAALIQDRPHKAFIATRETVSRELVNGYPELKGHHPTWVKPLRS